MNRTAALAFSGSMLALGGLAACGSSSGSTAPSASATASSASSSSAPASSAPASSAAASPSKAAPAAIAIKDFAYSGSTTVAPGAKIMVTNMDSEAHTVTADAGGAFDVKVDPQGTATFTAPSKPGSYPFHCTFHSNMHGMLKVG